MGKNSKQQEAAQLRAYRQNKEQAEREKKEQQKKRNRLIIGITAGALAFVILAVAIGVNVYEAITTAGWTDYVKLSVTYTDENGKAAEGEIIVKLCPEVAPITVKNFKKLVSKGFYDGLTFHRVYSGFMIQGGDPQGDGLGGSPNTIKGEFSANGVKNTLSHKRGVISMARLSDSYNSTSSYNSASSQFFIMHADNPSLDGQYAAFGYVVSGMETVDGIAGTEVQLNSSGEKTLPVHTVRLVKAEFVESENG